VRALDAVVAAACLAAGLALAAVHVLAPWAAVALLIAWAGVVLRWPRAWLVGVPAGLPLIALAPWTGVFVTEEWDLLVLGAAAGAYAARALSRPRATADVARPIRYPPWWTAGLALFALSALLSLWRAFADAGPVRFGLTQGYYETLNGVRVEKAFVFALLLAPLLATQMRAGVERALAALCSGFAVAGGIAATWVLWERAAFPGVLNFSTDYRVTGPFWEMHVGGAALDGFLALTLPFTVFALLRARRPIVVAAALALVGLEIYACLVTFSRGLYLALPVSLGVLAILVRTRPGSGHLPLTLARAGRAAGFCAGVILASAVAFGAAGYRGLGAALGAFALALPGASLARDMRPRDWALPGALGVLAGALAAALSALLPKGAYVMYGAAAVACGTLLWRARGGATVLRTQALAGLCGLVVMAVVVAVGWAGEKALAPAAAAVAAFVVLAVLVARSPHDTLRPHWQAHALIVGTATLLAAIVAVFSGGAYMAGRFAAGSSDFDERMQHWRDGLGMLQGPADWLLGKGAGRFPENYLFYVREAVFPGSYRLDVTGDKPHLTLSGPRYPTSFGDLFRVSQHVPAEPGTYVLTLLARADADVRLHVEICEKHLLYNEGCGIALVPVKASPGEWQRIRAGLDARAVTGGPWYARRPAYFSLAVETSGKSLDLADVSLVSPDRREVLANGDFSRGMARWFFSSDRYHLPWHIKSLPLNVLYDQGWIGLALFTLLVGGVLARLALGRARAHPAAPFIAAALAGFAVVGAFDSLTDVPRLAFAFWLLVFAGALLDARTAEPPVRGRVTDT
jgi:hypothetical protein